MELPPARVGDDLGEDLVERLVAKGDLRREAIFVLGEGHEMGEPRPAVAREVIPALIEDGVRQLASTVRTEVEEDHAVAVADRWWRALAGRHDASRHDEFVGGAATVALLDQGYRVGRCRSGGLHHRPVSTLGPLPSLVAVHRVVAAADRRNGARADRARALRQFRDVAGRTVGRLVPTVGEGMNEHAGHPQRLCHLEQCVQVLARAVHAAGRNKPDQVQRLAACD